MKGDIVCGMKPGEPPFIKMARIYSSTSGEFLGYGPIRRKKEQKDKEQREWNLSMSYGDEYTLL